MFFPAKSPQSLVHKPSGLWISGRVTPHDSPANYQQLQALSSPRDFQKAVAKAAAKVSSAGGERPKEDIKITWEHVETSLKTTRPSIAPAEQERLRKIYDEFIGARNGEMPTGQGSTEVGGRSSLM
jgi:hypothetical protein